MAASKKNPPMGSMKAAGTKRGAAKPAVANKPTAKKAAALKFGSPAWNAKYGIGKKSGGKKKS